MAQAKEIIKTIMAKILLIDDSASIREIVSFILTDEGHEVKEAEDGIKALQFAKRQSVDMVLTDLNMPNMDGITLTRELRKLTDYKFTPILILTIETGPDKKRQGKDAGATGWIEKPFDPDSLLTTVNRVLRKSLFEDS
jgi:two-component system chemotaxis response regulator CheY